MTSQQDISKAALSYLLLKVPRRLSMFGYFFERVIGTDMRCLYPLNAAFENEGESVMKARHKVIDLFGSYLQF